MKLLISLLVNGLLVLIAAEILSGVSISSYLMAIITGLVLGLINYTIHPIITFLTLPITVLTLGLFLLVINGAMVLLADLVIPGFDVDGLGWAILFSLLMSLFNLLVGRAEGARINKKLK